MNKRVDLGGFIETQQLIIKYKATPNFMPLLDASALVLFFLSDY